jgi:UDP-N-acetylglucosamine 2-epimerase
MTGLVIFGTRPEAIKLAPMVANIRGGNSTVDVGVVCTGQHAEIMTQTLNVLDLDVDENMNLMQVDQTSIASMPCSHNWTATTRRGCRMVISFW